MQYALYAIAHFQEWTNRKDLHERMRDAVNSTCGIIQESAKRVHFELAERNL